MPLQDKTVVYVVERSTGRSVSRENGWIAGLGGSIGPKAKEQINWSAGFYLAG